MHNNIKDGILLLDKNIGITSFQVVSKLRKLLNVKKVGHSGTLDKNASGLLVCGIGRSTKLLKHLIGLPKVYLAEFYFGIQTNTDDTNGKIVKEYEGDIEFSKISDVINKFKGTIDQTPPDFSAVHVNGKRAYKIALSDNKPELKKRKVHISDIETIDFTKNILKLKIACSSGTYIRSLARDIGLETGYYGHLYSLRRLSIGNFDISNSKTVENIQNNESEIITPYLSLDHLQEIEIINEHINDFKNGKKISSEWFKEVQFEFEDNKLYKMHNSKILLGIIKYNNGYFSYDLVY